MKIIAEDNNEEPAFVSGQEDAQALIARWQELRDLYLPEISADPLWRYSRAHISGDREQGWKLHISATILNAGEVLKKVAPYLNNKKALFKAPVSLLELSKLNSGIYYGYSQIGKFITVYPKTDKEAVDLARKLHKLTLGLSAPLIPFDLRFREDSCVYYRYGAFRHLEVENPDGTTTLVIRDSEGNLVPDAREAENAKPDWVSNPFPAAQAKKKPLADNPLRDRYKIFRAFSQRGKGGVYQAVDLGSEPVRLCVIKEGRRDGEVDWNGRDGRWHVKREERALIELRAKGVNVPLVYSSFGLENNFYLVTENIEGTGFNKLLKGKKRRLSIRKTLEFSIKLCDLIAEIHSAGWVWRDCKPANIIVTRDGKLRPLDFEGACRTNESAGSISGTEEFLPPEWSENPQTPARPSGDLYALGAVIYHLFTGQFYSGEKPVPVEKLRRKVPLKTRVLITKLLDANPPARTALQTAIRELKSDLKVI